MLSGVVVISGKDSVQHQGVSLTVEGTVNLQLSAKSVGVFEAFYNSVKVRLLALRIVSPSCGDVWWSSLAVWLYRRCRYFARDDESHALAASSSN